MTTGSDIGYDHKIQFVTYKDDPRAGLNDFHKKPDGSDCGGFITFAGSAWAQEFDGLAVWQVEAWEPLSLSPSLLCRVCGSHGYIREGKWVPA